MVGQVTMQETVIIQINNLRVTHYMHLMDIKRLEIDISKVMNNLIMHRQHIYNVMVDSSDFVRELMDVYVSFGLQVEQNFVQKVVIKLVVVKIS